MTDNFWISVGGGLVGACLFYVVRAFIRSLYRIPVDLWRDDYFLSPRRKAIEEERNRQWRAMLPPPNHTPEENKTD